MQAGARVVLRVQNAVLPLLHAYPGTAQVIGENDPVPDFDLHCPLLSLPAAFKTDATNIPAAIPYLHADPQKSAHWREIIGGVANRPRVGIAWAGLRTPSEHGNRSMQLAELAPLLAANAQFVSLQKDVPHTDRQSLRKLDSLLDVSDRLRTFADTAALVSQLDLVISIDTSVAHLAGALGTPVWIALQFTADWRWQMNRTDSPWYPQARLFRQAVRGDWAEVVDRLKTALDEWPQNRARLTREPRSRELRTRFLSVADDFHRVCDLGGFGQHGGRRTIFLVRQLRRAQHRFAIQRLTPDRKLHFDAREHFRILGRALGFQFNRAAFHRVPAALQNQHDVVRGAAAGADEQHFHRSRRQIAAAAVGRPVHGDQVTTSCLSNEAHSFAGPTHRTLQDFTPFADCCGDATDLCDASPTHPL